MSRRARAIITASLAALSALAIALPSPAGAFPYLTLNAAHRAIDAAERSEWTGYPARWTIYGCDHETLDPVLVWCESRGRAYYEGAWHAWSGVWEWAELEADGLIATGEAEG